MTQSNWDRTRRRMMLQDMFSTIDFSKLHFSKVLPPDDPDEDDEPDEDEPDNEEDEAALSPQLEQAIRALQTANPNLDRAHATYFLLHHPQGRVLFGDLSKRKEPIMDRATELQDIVKNHGGIQAMAKLFVATGKSLGGVTEPEFTALIDAEAQKDKRPGERPASAFARYYSAPENLELRKAIQITKTMSLQPTQVGGHDALDIDTDKSKAMLQLQNMAEDMRRQSPELSPSQAFARVFEHPDNAALAARAARRPAPTTSYPFPV